jgi:hypothetical protein
MKMIKPVKIWPKFKLENAQTMVEFALVFPLVLIITYGIIEFGRMVFIYTAVTGAAREGARYGAAGGNFMSRYYMDCTGILNAVQRGSLLLKINNSDVFIWYDRGPNTPHIKNSCPPMDANNMDLINMGDRIGVHVVAHYTPIIAFLGLGGFNIISENARTILVNVAVIGTAGPPPPTSTPPGPTPTTAVPTNTPVDTPTGQPTDTTTPGPSPTAACIVNGGGFEFHPSYFRWTITSLSTGLIRMESASISWDPVIPAYPMDTPTPAPPVYLTEIDVNVFPVWLGSISSGATITSWLGDESRRELSPGSSHTLSFNYSSDIPSYTYAVTLIYRDVSTWEICSVSDTYVKP